MGLVVRLVLAFFFGCITSLATALYAIFSVNDVIAFRFKSVAKKEGWPETRLPHPVVRQAQCALGSLFAGVQHKMPTNGFPFVFAQLRQATRQNIVRQSCD